MSEEVDIGSVAFRWTNKSIGGLIFTLSLGLLLSGAGFCLTCFKRRTRLLLGD